MENATQTKYEKRLKTNHKQQMKIDSKTTTSKNMKIDRKLNTKKTK